MKKLSTSKKILLSTIMLFTLFLLTNEKKSDAASYIWPVGGNNIDETYVEYNYGVRTYDSSAYDSKYNYSPYEKYYGKTENHYGVDITGIKNNTYSIVSVSDGKVVATSGNRYYNSGTNFVDRNQRRSTFDGGGYGNYVIIQETSTGKCFLYAHLKANTITVKKGDSVSAGQVIGTMGSSGDSGHMHLHFEVRKSLNTTTIDGGGSLVNTTNYNVQTEDPLLYISKPVQAKLTKVTYSYNSEKINLYLYFDKSVTVHTAPEITMSVGSESKLATFIGMDYENTKLKYELEYSSFSNSTSGQMIVKCDNSGNVVTTSGSETPIKCTFYGSLINLETPAQLIDISYTKYYDYTRICLDFDKEVNVKTAPTLTVSIGDKIITLDSAILSYDKKRLTYKLSYDNLSMDTFGDALVSCTNNGDIVTNSALARPVLCTFNSESAGTVPELRIRDNYKYMIKNYLGDIDSDGTIDSSDASIILSLSSKLAVGKELTYQEKNYLSKADVDNDGYVTAQDASQVLSYYSYCSTTSSEDIKKAILCDLNSDNMVNYTDYTLLQEAISESSPYSMYDLNKDGSLNYLDSEFFLETLNKLGKRN